MVYIVQSKEDLDKKIVEAGEKLIVIDFFANWCGPCKIIAPKLEELASLYVEQAMVLKVDVDDCEDIALDYNITSMPTFVFIKNNQIIDVFVGGNSERLVKSMEKYIGGEPIPVDGTTENETQTGADDGANLEQSANQEINGTQGNEIAMDNGQPRH